MGFTGAGGALVAIPLFMQFLDMTLKEASVLSLFAVVIASFSNFLAQKKQANYQLGFIIIFFSMAGSFISVPYKKMLPDFYVAVSLTAVSLYALYSVWKRPVIASTTSEKRKVPLPITVLIGFLLGVLTTFTGLGGGVLMVPVFLSVFSLTQAQAVATSLLTVSLSSLFSFIIQISAGSTIIWDSGLVFLIGGILMAAGGLKLLIHKLSAERMSMIRKLLFTAVVVMAIGKIF